MYKLNTVNPLHQLIFYPLMAFAMESFEWFIAKIVHSNLGVLFEGKNLKFLISPKR